MDLLALVRRMLHPGPREEAARDPGVTRGNGAYRIWPMDAQARALGDPRHESPNPTQAGAVEIFFGLVSPDKEIPANQLALQADLDKVLQAVRKLFLDADVPRPDRFRLYYVRLFLLAQLGLEGHAAPEAAKIALTALTDDLIREEAGRIKNGHLWLLGRTALNFMIPFALAYVLLSVLGTARWASDWSAALSFDLGVVRSFTALWIGCFLGVWLSYGMRTVRFTLADLTTPDADLLLPELRMLFAGTLTMILGLLFASGLVEMKIGGRALTDIATHPMLAFIVGTFCGISELSLPSSISKRAQGLVGKLE